MSEPLRVPPTSPEEQYATIEALLEGGLDLLEPEPAQPDPDRRPAGAALPGSGKAIELTPDDERGLADFFHQLCLEIYPRVMRERHDMEAEINDAYAMRPQPQAQGAGPGAAELVSTMTMTLTDQVSARITSNILTVDPLARFRAILGPTDPEDVMGLVAQASERCFNEYLLRVMRFAEMAPIVVQRACRVGTAVLHPEWIEEQKVVFGPNGERKKKKQGRVKVELIPNRNMVIWPPTALSWQEDYQLVGHHAFHTLDSFRSLATQLGLDETARALIETFPDGDPTQEELDKAAAEGLDLNAARDMTRLVRLTRLCCKMALPGSTEIERFFVIAHLGTRKILWIDYNPYRSQRHDYFPIRYKRVDECAWGNGVGHEVHQPFLVDTAISNLELDSLMAGAYWLLVRKSGSVHETFSEKVLPGQVVVSDDPSNDFVPKKMGGEVPELQVAKADNRFIAREASGQSSVLSGMGDPVQKSGTGTGATVALIEQAGKKFGEVDRSARADLSDFFQFSFEMLCQYAPDGVIYRHATAPDADKVQLVRYAPPSGEVGEMFEITASAPNAATSKEARKQMLLMVFQFVSAHFQAWMPMAQQALASNPAGFERLTQDVLKFQQDLVQRIVDENDMAALKVPGLPEPTPADEQINQLQAELAQVTQEYQSLQAQFQEHMAQMGMAPGMEAANVS